MGLLDRFKRAPGPDALTYEAVARARAVPGVAGAEAADADTVLVSWFEHPGTTTLSLADVREVWAKASGFDRIELMDQVVAGLAPPAPSAPDGGWDDDRARLTVVVDRPGRRPGAVRWTVLEGVEAVVALDGPDGPTVGDDELRRWSVAPDQVRAAAVDRLAATDPALDPIGPSQPAWVPTAAVAPAPAWLAAPAALLAACGLDQAVALAPLPTELVLVDPAATEVLASVLSSTTSIVGGEAEVLVGAPLLVTLAGVEVWDPPADHPCAALVEQLRAAG